MTHFILSICGALLWLVGALYAYRAVFLIIGLFATKKFTPAKKKYKYGILIAARNEENVLCHLLDSIHKQSYPSELVTVFVVADNCTDGTAEVARAHGAVCYERFDSAHRTKGYALQYLFKCIQNDYPKDAFDGYFIFDADNLLEYNYIEKMNDAFDSGEKLITSYRNSKNLTDNAISASYAFHWMRTARFENRGRSVLGMPVRIQGTGFLLAAELVKDGWNYTSLTEDRALTAAAVLQGVCITYQHEAVFYDEQPTSLSVAARQRLRWSKGHLQAFAETTLPLLCSMACTSPRKIAMAFDMILTNFPNTIPTTLFGVLRVALLAFAAPHTLPLNIFNLILKYLSSIPSAALLAVTERKRMQSCSFLRLVLLCVSFPIFSIIGDVATWAALFKKVEWAPIPHVREVGIENMQKQTDKS